MVTLTGEHNHYCPLHRGQWQHTDVNCPSTFTCTCDTCIHDDADRNVHQYEDDDDDDDDAA